MKEPWDLIGIAFRKMEVAVTLQKLACGLSRQLLYKYHLRNITMAKVELHSWILTFMSGRSSMRTPALASSARLFITISICHHSAWVATTLAIPAHWQRSFWSFWI